MMRAVSGLFIGGFLGWCFGFVRVGLRFVEDDGSINPLVMLAPFAPDTFLMAAAGGILGLLIGASRKTQAALLAKLRKSGIRRK